MTTIQPEYTKITAISIALSMALFTAFQIVFHIPVQLIFLKVGIVGFIVGLFWLMFEKWAWRWKAVRSFGYMKYPPDLNGRWEGTLQRVGEVAPHKFVLEIVQTYSYIKVNAYSAHSDSHSLTACLLTDEINSHYILISTWICTTRNTLPLGTVLEFHGTSIIELSKGEVGPKSRTLNDSYFTNRHPQTRGTTKLQWVGKQLYSTFNI